MNNKYQLLLEQLIRESTSIGDSKKVVVLQYLRHFEPCKSLKDDGAFMCNSFSICSNISEMIDVEANQISSVMVELGYHLEVDKDEDFSPGWVMKRV